MPLHFFKRHKVCKHDEDDVARVAHGVAMLAVVDPDHAPRGEFVGGFNPAFNPAFKPPPAHPQPARSRPEPYAYATPASFPMAPGPPPRPPQMPVPRRNPAQQTSMTMQFAKALPHVPSSRDRQLYTPARGEAPVRPQSDPMLPRHPNPINVPPKTPERPRPPVHAPHSAPSKPISARGPSTLQPVATGRKRAASVPPSPTVSAAASSTSDTVYCAGMTRNNTQCKNRVKIRAPLARLDSDANAELLRFCHMHAKKVLEPSKLKVRHPLPGQTYIDYIDWIPVYLSPSTQTNLRVEMEKILSDKDEDGYIYTFEIHDGSRPGEILFKVGRTVKVTKRMGEWNKQCGSKEQTLLGYHPYSADHDATTMKGRVRTGKPGPWCHRLERLIHLELADLAMHAQYLDPDFPNVEVQDSKVSARAAQLAATKPCPDCGKLHKEIFAFKRAESGKYEDREWELLVKPVIEKWGRFVAEYLRAEP